MWLNALRPNKVLIKHRPTMYKQADENRKNRNTTSKRSQKAFPKPL